MFEFTRAFSLEMFGIYPRTKLEKQAANLAHLTLLTKIFLLIHIILWREIQTQQESYQL